MQTTLRKLEGEIIADDLVAGVEKDCHRCVIAVAANRALHRALGYGAMVVEVQPLYSGTPGGIVVHRVKWNAKHGLLTKAKAKVTK